ncbi:hypothetical protein N7447_008175 [Penicillium robsamsonii]|uniref:uncharacterized protein n=1 Tax=Penicillium robsamsonii TaxID=1792511 RepID=UPI002546E4BE|nr:uncharacterized protein N7447_008175 [Penicillium robsamsonii]KAJ5815942.1 hypothetical protein N7447_008175 [Penicillium robsamsonii]
MASPFHISRHQQVELERNEAFRVMREQLRRQECGMERPSFCAGHRHSCTSTEQETFRLHRDIIHTLLVPLFLINHQAERIAARTLPTQKGAEPERAFRGEARSAFAWLNCILTEEHDCPLSSLHRPSRATLRADNPIRHRRFPARRCPLRIPVLAERPRDGSLRRPLWGDAFWPDIEERAARLTDGVQQLVRQCYELSVTLDNPARVNPSLAKNPMPVYGSRSASCTIPLKPSSFARKQVRLTREEQRYRSSFLWNCSEMTQPLAGCTTATRSRRRSLTS